METNLEVNINYSAKRLSSLIGNGRGIQGVLTARCNMVKSNTNSSNVGIYMQKTKVKELVNYLKSTPEEEIPANVNTTFKTKEIGTPVGNIYRMLNIPSKTRKRKRSYDEKDVRAILSTLKVPPYSREQATLPTTYLEDDSMLHKRLADKEANDNSPIRTDDKSLLATSNHSSKYSTEIEDIHRQYAYDNEHIYNDKASEKLLKFTKNEENSIEKGLLVKICKL